MMRLVCFAVLFSGCSQAPPEIPANLTVETLSANRIELIDATGKVRAALRFQPEKTDLGIGAGLVVYDADGNDRAVFYVDSFNRSVLRMHDASPSGDEARFDAMVNENGPGSLITEIIRTDILNTP